MDFATDVFGNPVPASSSTIGVNTATASINGHVYNDINQSGIYTNGDAGLSSVTLQLFTDPNGDGDPSDGTLVQITTSDANGYYELLNLNLGHYVVVATTLPGYRQQRASQQPARPQSHQTLTVSTNNNFFQYVPAPSVYSTISGKVWYDLNGNGTNDVVAKRTSPTLRLTSCRTWEQQWPGRFGRTRWSPAAPQPDANGNIPSPASRPVITSSARRQILTGY